jgi:hypothetical protein
MDQKQATEILEHLLEAAHELDEAKAAAAVLAEQDEDAASLKALVIGLNSELLGLMFDRFPDLMPFEEFPAISSGLRWDEVKLGPSVTESHLDGIIFSFLKPRPQKMALVVLLAIKRCEELGLPISDEAIAARLQILADSDRIEGFGDLRKWRHSEVRLKD